MNKQLVNLIGATASIAIVLLAVTVVALPQLTQANRTNVDADTVAAQNTTQQLLLDSLTAQAADMTQLQAEVDDLRAEIPATPNVDDVLLLAIDAAQTFGGTVTAVAPAVAEPFAVRTETDAAATGATSTEAATTEASADTTEASEAETTASDDTAAIATPAPADEAQQVSVTVTISAPDVETATAILDELRSGTRLVAVTQAGVASGTEGSVSLSVTLLAFARP